MGIQILNSTLEGAVTPTCNCCGVSLCWDIDEIEYLSNKEFWDKWICKDCNGGKSFSLKEWRKI